MPSPDNAPPRGSVAATAAHQRRGTGIPADLRSQLSPEDEGRIVGKIAPRPTYTEAQLDEAYKLRMSPEEQRSRKQNLLEQRKLGKEKKNPKAIALGILLKVFPFINIFLHYKPKEYAIYDLLSGISVGLFAIPQAIAFALLANLKPQYGFYSAFFAMAIYFFFGTSNHLNMTHQGAVSLLVGDAVLKGVQQVYPGNKLCAEINATEAPVTGATDPIGTTVGALMNTTLPEICTPVDEARILVSISITMVVGAVQLLMGFLRFGFLTIYLPDPLNSAFTCGAALHILSSQLGNMLGTTIPPISQFARFFLYFVEAFKKIINSDVNMPTILVFIGFFAALLAVKLINEKCSKYVKIPIPIDILVLVSSLLLSRFLDWEGNLNVAAIILFLMTTNLFKSNKQLAVYS